MKIKLLHFFILALLGMHFSILSYCQETNTGAGVDAESKLKVTKLTTEQEAVLKNYAEHGQSTESDDWIKNNISDPKMQWVLRYIHNVNRDSYVTSPPESRSIEALKAQVEFALTFISFRNEKHNKLAGLPLKEIFEKNRKDSYFKIALTFHPEPVGKVLSELKNQGYILDEFESGVVKEVQTFRDALSRYGRNSQDTKSIELTGHTNKVTALVLSHNGKTLYSGSDDITIRVWNLKNNPPTSIKLTGHTDWVNSLVLSPDGNTLYSGSDDATIRAWNLKNTTPTSTVLNGRIRGWTYSLVLSPDGNTLYSGYSNGTISVWNLKNNPPTSIELGQTSRVNSNNFTYLSNSLVLSPNGSTLYSGSWDSTIRVWNLKNNPPTSIELKGHTGSVSSLVLSPDGNTLYSASADHMIRVWNLKNNPPTSIELKGHTSWVYSLALSPDGKTLYSGSRDHMIRAWDLKSDIDLDKLYEVYNEEIHITPVFLKQEGEACKTSSINQAIDGTGLNSKLKDLKKVNTFLGGG